MRIRTDDGGRLTLANLLVFVLAVAIVAAGVSIRVLYGEPPGSNHHHADDASVDLVIDDASDRLIVDTATDLQWSDVLVRATGCQQPADRAIIIRLGAADPFFDDPANGSGASLNQAAAAGTACGAYESVLVSSDPGETIVPGQTLGYCAWPGDVSEGARQVTIELWHAGHDERLGRFVFADVGACHF